MFKLFKFIRLIYLLVVVLVGLGFGLLGVSAYQVYDYAHLNNANLPEKRDAVVVLGAAAWGNKPSPVFQERIKHGIFLYKNQIVNKIIFTGGTPNPNFATEAQVAKQFALKQGIPQNAILLENHSRNTFENLLKTKELMEKHNIQSVIIVSDPYHLARAMVMANYLNLNAISSATPTSRYNNSDKGLDFFIRETIYLSLFRLNWLIGLLDETPITSR